MNNHIDPAYVASFAADMPAPDAPPSEWAAYWQRVLDAAVTVDAINNAAERLAFWRAQVKPVQPAPVTNEQRRLRREER